MRGKWNFLTLIHPLCNNNNAWWTSTCCFKIHHIQCVLPLCPWASWLKPVGCDGWWVLLCSFPWRRMPSPDSHGHDILLLGHLQKARNGWSEKEETLLGMNHHVTASLKGKVSIISSSQYSCFLTADGVDLNAPEGERGKLYYFCLTERSLRHGQSKE